MVEIVKSYDSTEEYIKAKNKEKIDNLYKEAADKAIGKKVIEDMIPEAVREVADAEAELSILEELFVQDKVDRKEVTNAKRRYTKAKNILEDLFKEKEG